jgi:DNA-binding response OmpR family regulator
MPKTVLFVDDDKNWRLMVETFLEDAGYDVVCVSDAAEALLRLNAIQPALILLDLDLGGENGLMLMKFVKQSHPDVPVMLYTGLEHGDQFVQNMLKQGADQYLRKGTMEQLLAAVRSALP